MEFLIGVTGPGYVLVATDVLNVRSIMVLTGDMNKVHPLSAHQVLCATGEAGEVDRLKERLQAEAALAHFRMGRPWSTKEVAWFTRSLLAENLRTRSPHQCEILIAGVDDAKPGRVTSSASLESTASHRTIAEPTGSLYWMDHLGSLLQLPYAAHGYGAFFTWGLLDSKYKPNMTVDESINLLSLVIREIQTRFIVQLPRLSFTLIDGSGMRQIGMDWDLWRTQGQVSWSFMDAPGTLGEVTMAA